MAQLNDKAPAIGTQAAQPASGTVTLTANKVEYPHFWLEFELDAALVTITDAAASGSHGALKLFDFNPEAVAIHGCRQNYTAFAEGSALTGGAGDASFDIGVGSAAIAAAADGALAGTDDDIGAEVNVTLSSGTGTGSGVTGASVFDGTSTAIDLALNISGTATTIDATSTLAVTGTITVAGTMLGSD